MNEEILSKYSDYLRQEYRKKRTQITYYNGVSLFLDFIKKDVNEITIDDLRKWKTYLNNNKKQNSTRIWIYSVNKFFKWLGKPDIKLSIPNCARSNKIILNNEEIDRFLQAAKDDPLHNLVALLIYDAIRRPGEIADIKRSNIDSESSKLYLDDSKTGDNYTLISPRLQEAIHEYLLVRPKPLPGYEEYLIINPHSNGKGKKYKYSTSIREITKKIAVKAGIKKKVTPYILKSTAITLRLNDKANPRTIQRLACHKNINTTLKYDQSTDQDALEYLRRQDNREIDFNILTPEDQAKKLLDMMLKGEIDKQTFKAGIELIKPETSKNENRCMDGYV
ncbi:MAG: hypothetical protein EU535_08365 [Promethearchaeota archaeon]|nr:MAG: hypothetical protein EU535_08365 [Candidatus Lokiarchaeota archaeon]